jgi:hypothetical protein
VGYIDSDTHVIEDEHTWEFFDPGEEQFRPRVGSGHWSIQDVVIPWPGPGMSNWIGEVFPAGAVDLRDPTARVRYMDALGVDVHVLFPTFWLLVEVASPAVEAALSRSYNRWLAEATSECGGRLAWAVHAPVRTMERAMQMEDWAVIVRDSVRRGAVQPGVPTFADGLACARVMDAVRGGTSGVGIDIDVRIDANETTGGIP